MLKETTLTVSDSVEMDSSVESKGRVISFSTMEITEITRLKKKKTDFQGLETK